jgi:hypothetical protein
MQSNQSRHKTSLPDSLLLLIEHICETWMYHYSGEADSHLLANHISKTPVLTTALPAVVIISKPASSVLQLQLQLPC